MVSLRQVQVLALACVIGACVDAAPENQYGVPPAAPAVTDFNPYWQPPANKVTPRPVVATQTPAPVPVAPKPVPELVPEPAPVPAPEPAPEPASEPAPTEPPSPVPDAPETTTPAANSTDTSEVETETPAPVPATSAPTPAPTKYVPPPVPNAGTASLAKVENPVCDDNVVQTIYDIYSKNRNIFDVCAEKTQYQIFPFSGKLPTPKQIHALTTTDACLVLFTTCVVAKLPECDTSGLNLKAVTESLLKFSVDVENGHPAPGTQRFHEMHYWRRDSNLAKAAGLPYGNDSALYAEYVRDLPVALDKYSVQVRPDLSIVYNGTDVSTTGGHSYFFNTTTGSRADVVADVHPNEGAQDNGEPNDGASGSTAKVKTMSAATSPAAALVTVLFALFSSTALVSV